MSRVEPVKHSSLNARAQRIGDEIAAARDGVVGGPFAIWLRNADLADAANRLGNTLRLSGQLDRRLFQLIVLLVARHWGARYAWSVHADAARDSGLASDVIEAIRTDRAPALTSDEAVIYAMTRELLRTRAVSDTTYADAVAVLGLEGVIEAVAVAGFYTMVALTLVAFDIDARDGSRPFGPSAG